MLRRFCLGSLVLVSFAFLSSAALSARDAFDTPWPLLPGGKTSEEGQVWGRLDNGLRYAIMASEPGDQLISMRLVVGAGYAREGKEFAGASLLLEDLMWQGTERFDRDRLAVFLLANGMTAQERARFATELDYGVYRLDLERGPEGGLTEGLELLSDVLGGLKIDAAGVEKSKVAMERNVLSPIGLSVPETVRNFGAVYQGRSFPQLVSEEQAKLIRSLKVEQVQAFWDRWYRPENAVLFVTGAIDAEATKGLIEATFGSLSGRGAAGEWKGFSDKPWSAGDVEMVESRDIFADVSISNLSGSLDLFKPADEERYRLMDVVGRYANALASNRDGVGGDAVAMIGDRAQIAVMGRSSVLQLQEKLLGLDRVTHRLERFGVRKQDFDKIMEGLRDLYQSYDIEWSERERASVLADRLVLCLTERMPFRRGAALKASLEKTLSGLTVDTVSEAAKGLFREKDLVFLVRVTDGIGLTAKRISKRLKGVRKTYDFTWEQAGTLDQDWGLTAGFPSAGIVESTNRLAIGANDVFQYVFANRVRLNVVRTTNNPGQFHMRVSVGNGLSDYPAPYAGLEALTRQLLPAMEIGSGVQTPSIREIVDGKGMTFLEGGANYDQIFWSAIGESEDDLYDFFSTLVIWMVTGKVSEEDFDKAVEELTSAGNVDTVTGSFRKLDQMMFSADPRIRLSYTSEDVEDVSYADFSAWLLKAQEEGYIEITIVGDVSPRTALRDVRKTFGSAPDRKGKVTQPRHGRVAKHREAGIVRGTHKGPKDGAHVAYYWPYPGDRSCQSDFQLEVLNRLLDEYLERVSRERSDELDTVLINRIGLNMVPGSYGLRIEVKCDPDWSAEAESLLSQIGEGFEAFLTPELVAAAERNEWVRLARMVYSDSLLVNAFDQGQGKPYVLECDLKRLSTGGKMPYETYLDMVGKVFAESNARGVTLTPGSGK